MDLDIPSDGDGHVSDPDRLAALDRSRLLDSPPEEAFDRLTRLASRLLDVPVALVSLVDDRRQFFKSAVGLSGEIAESRATSLSHSFCRHVVDSGVALAVEDAREHPLVRDNPSVEAGAISYCGVPIVDPAGRTLGTLCVLHSEPRPWSPDDIHALQDLAAAATAEVRLRFIAQDLADTGDALRKMVATASHDIRNPLAVIKGYAGLLADEDNLTDAERKEFASHIRDAASQAHALITDLAHVSRLEAGTVKPRPTVIAVGAAARSVIDQNHAQGFDEVLVTVPDELKAIVDPAHFSRILTNLLTNAVRYAGKEVQVDGYADGDSAVISVSDSGPGVPDDLVPRVFEKFSRGDDAVRAAPEGSGLGLSIVAGLVRANGGRVRYEPNTSAGGHSTGASFVVELPLSS